MKGKMCYSKEKKSPWIIRVLKMDTRRKDIKKSKNKERTVKDIDKRRSAVKKKKEEISKRNSINE